MMPGLGDLMNPAGAGIGGFQQFLQQLFAQAPGLQKLSAPGGTGIPTGVAPPPINQIAPNPQPPAGTALDPAALAEAATIGGATPPTDQDVATNPAGVLENALSGAASAIAPEAVVPRAPAPVAPTRGQPINNGALQALTQLLQARGGNIGGGRPSLGRLAGGSTFNRR